MQQQVLVLSMVSARADTGQTVSDDLQLVLFGSSHHAHESLLATEHPIWSTPVDRCQGRGIVAPVLRLLSILLIVGIVVTLERAHQVETSDALLGIVWNGHLDVGKGASLHELVRRLVNLRILVIHLDLVE